MAKHLAGGPEAHRAPRVSEERELVLAFQSGESAAGEFIHDRYRPMVRSICGRLLRDPEDVQEAVQETFVRVFAALPRFNGSYQLGAWIARIARNVCLDQIRARSRADRRTSQVEDLEEFCLPDWSGDPQEVLVKGVERSRVVHTLAALPRRYRTAIILRDLQGLTYAEIATVLSIPRYQVRNFLHRGRKAFRRLWHSREAAGLLALPIQLLRRIAAISEKRVAHLQNGAKVQGSDIIVQAGEVARSAAFLESGHWFIERVAAASVAVTLLGVGAPSSSSVELRSRHEKRESVGEQMVQLESDATSTASHPSEAEDDPMSPGDVRSVVEHERASSRGLLETEEPAVGMQLNDGVVTEPDENTTPAAEKPTPAAEKPTPGAEKPTPAAEKPTPGAEKPTPGAEKPTPGAEEPIQAADGPIQTDVEVATAPGEDAPQMEPADTDDEESDAGSAPLGARTDSRAFSFLEQLHPSFSLTR